MRPFDYSFEFFPPKTQKAKQRLDAVLDDLEILNPEFVSVTYGAGGTTQGRTFKAVKRIVQERTISAATHLTCVGASREEVDNIIADNLAVGINHFVALRGDPPEGIDGAYNPEDSGYAYASDLVRAIRRQSERAEISVSAYPERHPESADWSAELDNLKRKVDAGATRAITQFFFEAETFLSFLERARSAGITIPIVPGIMLQPNFEGLCRISHLCGVDVPGNIASAYQNAGKGDVARNAVTIDLATKLVDDLRVGGVEHFHFYTLNMAPLAIQVIKNTRAHGRREWAA